MVEQRIITQNYNPMMFKSLNCGNKGGTPREASENLVEELAPNITFTHQDQTNWDDPSSIRFVEENGVPLTYQKSVE